MGYLLAEVVLMTPEDNLLYMLGEINAKVERVLHAVDKQDAAHKEIEQRVHKIETRINRAAGVFTVVISLIAFAGQWIMKKLGISA